MLFTQNYQNQSVHVETTACQSWLIGRCLSLAKQSDDFRFKHVLLSSFFIFWCDCSV